MGSSSLCFLGFGLKTELLKVAKKWAKLVLAYTILSSLNDNSMCEIISSNITNLSVVGGINFGEKLSESSRKNSTNLSDFSPVK